MNTIFLIGIAIAIYFIALIVIGLAGGAGESITATPTTGLADGSISGGRGGSIFDDGSLASSSVCSYCGSINCVGVSLIQCGMCLNEAFISNEELLCLCQHEQHYA